MRAIMYGPMENVLFLLHQKMSPINEENLLKCTEFASKIGLTNVVSETLRIRNGSKFTKEVDEMSGDVIVKRVIAKKMSQYFDDHHELYLQMKDMILMQLNEHVPFSDDLLLGVLVYAKDKFQGLH